MDKAVEITTPLLPRAQTIKNVLGKIVGTLPFGSKAAAQLASVNFDRNSTLYTALFILNGLNYNNYRLNTFDL